MFLVLEGIDGSGKDTQAKLLCDWLEQYRKKNNFLTKIHYEIEPTKDSDAGRKIYSLLLRKNNGLKKSIDKIDSKEILNLYLEDRFHHTKKVREYLKVKDWIVSSRYDLSCYAYQTIDKREDELLHAFENIYDLHKYHSGTLIPDCTFFFSLSINTVWERLQKRLVKHGFEKYELLKKVENNYIRAIKFLQKKDQRNIVVVDASRDIQEIFCSVKSLIIKNHLNHIS